MGPLRLAQIFPFFFMRKILSTIFILAVGVGSIAGNSPGLRFTKNLGQVYDQNQKPQSGVAYYGQTGNLHFFLSSGGISYQMEKHEMKFSEKTRNSPQAVKAYQYLAHRVDFKFVGARSTAMFNHGDALRDRENFIQSNGSFMDADAYSEVYLKELYKGISIHYYSSGSQLKYDYLIAPGQDYKKIQIQINGAEDISISYAGDLEIKTSAGTFSEQKPIAFQNGKELKTRFVLEGNQLSFDIEGVNAKDTLVIDPITRLWGTYYGTDGSEDITSVATDPFGNVVVCGVVFSAGNVLLSTPGTYQLQSSGVFVAKLDSTGARLWCTYYGYGLLSSVYECNTDLSGNIYVTGECDHPVGTSTINFSSAGAFQTSGMGQEEAFLLKLSPSGWRLWCTLYGGGGSEKGMSCTTDNKKNVYMLTCTGSSTNNLSTTGAFLNSYYQNLLVKFDSLGNRLWATYYPGGFPFGPFHRISKVRTDPSDNVVIALTAADYNMNSWFTPSHVASPGAWQQGFGGAKDAVIAKFDEFGNRLWGTCYGGQGDEEIGGLAVDNAGNIFISGVCQAASASVVTSPSCHQSVYGGDNWDGFIAKFNANGTRVWGTLYGGAGLDQPSGLSVVGGTLYGVGVTDQYSNQGIALLPTFQAQGGGDTEGFIFLFDTAGTRLWASYYGGSGYDYFNGISVTSTRRLYAGGLTASPNSAAIASTGAFQTTMQNGDGFITHFFECTPQGPINNTILSKNIMCGLESPTLTANAIGPINWFSSLTSTNALYTGNTYTLPILAPGQYTWYAEALDPCSGTAIRTPITLTVNATSTLNVPSGSVCAGQVFTIMPQSTTSFTYYFSSITNTLVAYTNTMVQVTAIAAGYCSVTATCNIQVLPKPNLTINASQGFVCSGSSVTLSATGASSYTWSLGGTVSTCTIAPLANTIYTVSGANQSGCMNQATYTQFAYLCNGVSENAGDRFSIYPNPARTKINIVTSGNDTEIKYQLVDAIGRVLKEGKFSATIEIDIENFAAGVYLLSVVKDREKSVMRLVKE